MFPYGTVSLFDIKNIQFWSSTGILACVAFGLKKQARMPVLPNTALGFLVEQASSLFFFV